MIQNSTISIPAGTKFLSDVISHLPENCLFNKGATGAGGTTIALTNDLPTVICVPHVAMITNKVDQAQQDGQLYPYPVFGYYSEVADLDLLIYINSAPVPKIMVTYDSLHRLVDNLDFEPTIYTLLVDEYHSLFKEYIFRNKAARSVLGNFRKFKSFTFMTATPIGEESLLAELKDIPVCDAVWENSITTCIKPIVCTFSLHKVVSKRIQWILERKLPGNHYFFVNSVNFIIAMVNKCKLHDENCRVIYSATSNRKLKVQRGKPSDPAKKINFITKTAFEGVDFYDEEGVSYVISDAHNEHSLIDISTQLPQIAGRIRDSKYKASICHLYSTTKHSQAISWEDFIEGSNKRFDEEDKLAASLMKMECTTSRMRFATERDWPYHVVNLEAMTITPDPNLRKFENYAYKVRHQVYRSHVNVGEEYERYNLEAYRTMFQMPNPDLLAGKTISFERLVRELETMYLARVNADDLEYNAFLDEVVCRFPFVTDALVHLGFEGIKKMNYHPGNIKKYLKVRKPDVLESAHLTQVAQMVWPHPKLSNGRTITYKEVKQIFADCYKELGISMIAKSVHIGHYFHVEERIKTIEGKRQRIYQILSQKHS